MCPTTVHCHCHLKAVAVAANLSHGFRLQLYKSTNTVFERQLAPRRLPASSLESNFELASIFTTMESLTQRLTTRAAVAEKQLEELTNVVNRLTNGNGTHGLDGSQEMDPVKNAEQEKLKYRLGVLKRAVSEEENREVTTMKNLVQMIRLYFTIAVDKTYPDLSDVKIQVTPTALAKYGDYQCNAALPISALLKAKGIMANPHQVAQDVLKNFPSNTGVVDRFEVAGPGFINIYLSDQFLKEELRTIFLHGVRLSHLSGHKRVIVDFSSPNVAKEMHVGHLRSTVIGESTCRLLEYLGYDVLRLNHIGDWGTQFGMLIAHLQDTFADYLKEGKELPVSDLQEFYKVSKKRFDEDEEFKKRAFSCVVALQAHNPDYIKAWNMICDVSRKEFTKIYDRLDVKIIERGESFYQDRMVAIVKELSERGFLEDDEAADEGKLQGVRKIIWASGKKTKGEIPLTVVKSDGGFTYDTSDMAAIKNRIEEEQADWVIYITDAGQATHFETIFACAKRVGIWDPSKVRIDHLGFGVVLGEDKKKFKTRSGDTVKLVNLMEEGIKRAGEKLLEKGRDKEMTAEEFKATQLAVAYGCIKYADLCHDRNREYIFSFDKMLDDKGNTAVYLLYAYTRIKSIARKAGVTEDQLRNYALKNPFIVTHEKEAKLIKKLLRFPEVIERVVEELFLHTLCELLYDISTSFTEFYDVCYCIEKDQATGEIKKIHMNRLILCEATASVMKKLFTILGLETVEKM